MNKTRILLLVFSLTLVLLAVACAPEVSSPDEVTGDEIGIVYSAPT